MVVRCAGGVQKARNDLERNPERNSTRTFTEISGGDLKEISREPLRNIPGINSHGKGKYHENSVKKSLEEL